MLWSFERFDIGRPHLSSYEPYENAMYHLDADGAIDIIDRPTMGTLWTKRNVSIFYFIFFILIVCSSVNSVYFNSNY